MHRTSKWRGKEALEQIYEEFCDRFYLENDVLTCTSIVSHEINTHTDSAPMNVCSYRLPEKHKKEVSRQIEKIERRNHMIKYQPMECANIGSSQKSDASRKINASSCVKKLHI